MNSMNFTYTDFNDVEVTMNVPERSIDEMCEYFQRFLSACGYVFEDKENIKVVRNEEGLNQYTSHGNFDPWAFDSYNYLAGEFVSSGMQGGMGEDVITFG